MSDRLICGCDIIYFGTGDIKVVYHVIVNFSAENIKVVSSVSRDCLKGKSRGGLKDK